MWYFRSPEIVFGEDALEHLETLLGRRAFIITDNTMLTLGFVDHIGQYLSQAGLAYDSFSQVEREPAMDTIHRGADKLSAYQPDWIIGLGGGSVIDAAKAMWVLYENPGYDLEAVNPFADDLVLRQKARLIAIPTTSGTGSECTWALVLTDAAEGRKLGLGNPNLLPDIAIIDPLLPQKMPARLTADTGFDVLTQAIEGYTCALHNDFSDGLCLKAIQLVFDYLPRAVKDGADLVAREKMHNAATLAGLGFGNAMAALAHSLGHSLGAIFTIPHGRAVGLFLPYTIQYLQNGPTNTRFDQISRFLGLSSPDQLVTAIHELARTVGQPLTIADLPNITAEVFERELDHLVANAEADSVITMSSRIPTTDEIAAIFRYVYTGQAIDF